jgi:hypothetical protein
VAERVYVPGFGYVTQGSAGTSGTVQKGPKQRVTGQESRRPAVTPNSSDPFAALGVKPSQAFTTKQQESATTNATSSDVRYDLTYPTGYRPPINYGATADRMQDQINTLPLIYKIQNAGDLREAYWGDPESRAVIQAAARVYYRDYSNYNDQWAEKFWQEDIMGAALNPGSPPPWQMLQSIFAGETKASGGDTPGGASYSSGGGYGYGGGGGGGASMGSVSLTDPTSARGLLLQTMQGVLGRNPTSKEYKDFLDTLNRVEMENPRTVSIEGDVAVQSGGTDPAAIAMDFAENRPDARRVEMRRATDLLLTAMGGI